MALPSARPGQTRHKARKDQSSGPHRVSKCQTAQPQPEGFENERPDSRQEENTRENCDARHGIQVSWWVKRNAQCMDTLIVGAIPHICARSQLQPCVPGRHRFEARLRFVRRIGMPIQHAEHDEEANDIRHADPPAMTHPLSDGFCFGIHIGKRNARR